MAQAERGLVWLHLSDLHCGQRGARSQWGVVREAVLESHPHVAAQLLPEEGRVLDPVRARAYCERFFGRSRIDLYWGTAQRFLTELQRQLEEVRR